TRRVGHDKGAPRRREIPIGHVDGDALLAFGLQAIEQQGKIDFPPGSAVLFRIAFECGTLVIENKFLLVEQAADQRRLAVVDRAASQKPQRRARIGAVAARSFFLGCGGRGAAHQKYPSRFFFSIEPASSWSMRRPCRSELVESRISAMMASSVSAADGTAPVNG